MTGIVSAKGQNSGDATTSIRLLDGDAASLSVVGAGFSGTVALQRNFNSSGAPAEWRTVASYTTDAEFDYVARCAQGVRLVILAATAGTVEMEIRKSSIRTNH